MFQWSDLCHVPYFSFFVWNFKKSFVFIYLAVLGLSFGLQDLCCITSSCRSFRCGAQTRQLRCAGAVAPRRTGSLLCQGLGCPPSEYGIFVLRPGIKPTSPALQGEILTTGPRRKFLISFIFNFNQFVCSRAIWQRLSFRKHKTLGWYWRSSVAGIFGRQFASVDIIHGTLTRPD